MILWPDLMADLETMGKPPSGAICAIGACFFNIQTREIGPTFSETVNLATAVREGGTIDPSTVIWWMTQSEEARRGIAWSARDIKPVMTEFIDFMKENSDVKTVRVWGNSSTFDMTILSTAIERMGMKQPWFFTRERCFRTVRNMYPSIEYNPDDKGTEAHNALADAIFQAKHLFKIKDKYGRDVSPQGPQKSTYQGT